MREQKVYDVTGLGSFDLEPDELKEIFLQSDWEWPMPDGTIPSVFSDDALQSALVESIEPVIQGKIEQETWAAYQAGRGDAIANLCVDIFPVSPFFHIVLKNDPDVHFTRKAGLATRGEPFTAFLKPDGDKEFSSVEVRKATLVVEDEDGNTYSVKIKG